MYTECRIQYVDDQYELDVIIKSDDEVDVFDEEIFFYGLTRDEILSAHENGDIIEGEWKIISVGETYPVFPG